MIRFVSSSFILLACACGGAAKVDPPANTQAQVKVQVDVQPQGAGSHPEVASGDGPTRFQRSRLIGHYSTTDGTSGFILDRTKTPFRARLDGAKEARTLSERGSGPGYRDYHADDKSIWIRVDKDSGEVLLFQGPTQHEGVDVVHDANAEPL